MVSLATNGKRIYSIRQILDCVDLQVMPVKILQARNPTEPGLQRRPGARPITRIADPIGLMNSSQLREPAAQCTINQTGKKW
jgi:hypothetical protein